MSLKTEFEDTDREAIVKAIADKLYNGIATAYDKGERRRWIWELVQNAKDTPIAPEIAPVKIKVHCKADDITFEHNADPFDIKSLTGLIRQTSSKGSNANPETTGKFGTGFITTHMLSKVVRLKSILAYSGGAKSFTITLDRQGESSEDLIEKVKQSLDERDALCDDTLFPLLKPEDLEALKGGLNTKFSYSLTPNTLQSAQEGIQDLCNNAAFVLLFNKRIGQIEIINEVGETHLQIARHNTTGRTDHVSLFHTTIQNLKTGTAETQTLAYVRADEGLILAVPVTLREDGEIDEVLGLEKKLPVLFKDFPLVGTNNWMFDLVCNCEKFEPTDPRDGIYLHADATEYSPKVTRNREMTGKIFAGVLALIKTLGSAAHPPKGLYRLMRSGLPAKETQKDVRDFLEALQTAFRDEAKQIAIVQTHDSLKPIAACRFPMFTSSGNSRPEDDLAFYRLCTKAFLDVVPIESEFLNWLEIIQSESHSWNDKAALGLEELLGHIQSAQTLAGLGFATEAEATGWLNEIYAFLEQHCQKSVYDRFRIVPNQSGNFILAKDAFKEADGGIPGLLKDVGASFGKSYRDTLVPDELLCDAVSKTRTIKEISRELNELIGRTLSDPKAANTASLSAAARMCNTTTGTRADDERLRIIKHLSPFMPVWQETPVEAPQMKGDEFDFGSALRATVRYCLYSVAQLVNLAGLGKQIGIAVESEIAAWLQELMGLVEGRYELKAFAEEYRLYPDQIGDLHFVKDLARDVDAIAPFLKKIHNQLFVNHDILTELLRLNFHTDKIVKSQPLSTLATKIDQELDVRYRKGETDIALDMISWLSNQPEAVEEQFPRLKSNKPEIVFVSLPKEEKDPLFKLIKSKADFEKLAKIAESKHLDAITAAVESGLDAIQISKLQEIVSVVGGVDNLQSLVDIHMEEQRDLAFLKNLGAHVENLFKESIGHLGDVAKVEREGYEWGQDFAIKFMDGTDYLVEVKSFAPGKEKVHMSKRQGETAVCNPTNYALCVLERTTELGNVTNEYFQKNARFVMDIGYRLKGRVEAAARIETMIEQEEAGDEEGVDFDNRNFRYKIGKKVWNGEKTAHSFQHFMQRLLEMANTKTDMQDSRVDLKGKINLEIDS